MNRLSLIIQLLFKNYLYISQKKLISLKICEFKNVRVFIIYLLYTSLIINLCYTNNVKNNFNYIISIFYFHLHSDLYKNHMKTTFTKFKTI